MQTNTKCCHAFGYQKRCQFWEPGVRFLIWGPILVPNLITCLRSKIHFLASAISLGGMRIETADCTFYQCAGSGRTHMCCAALARVRTASKARWFVYQPCSAQDRQVKVSVCRAARAHHQRALAERLRRENDRRAVKQIALARCALIILAATLGSKTIASHCRVEGRTRWWHLTSPRRARLHRLIVPRRAPVQC